MWVKLPLEALRQVYQALFGPHVGDLHNSSHRYGDGGCPTVFHSLSRSLSVSHCLFHSITLSLSLALPPLSPPLVVSSILLPPAAPGETKPVKITPLGVAFHQWASCLVFFFTEGRRQKKNGGITHTSVRDGGEHRPASLNLPQREGTLCDTSDDAPFHSPPLTPVTASDGWPV